jgi:serine/threonine protein kinase
MHEEAFEVALSPKSLAQAAARDNQNHHTSSAPGDGINTAEGSLASSSGTQQTRFSFYNAQDFVPKTAPETASPRSSNPGRFNFAEEDETVQRRRKNGNSSNGNSNSKKNKAKELDPVEILRSLQEHEQQRSDILGGPTTSGTTDNSAAGTTSLSSNPYEDAIKEALDLLRKHRYTENGGKEEASLTTATFTSPKITSATTLDPLLLTLDPELQQLQNIGADDPILQNRGLWEDLTSPTGTESSLGEAYQVEIEARRKQRKERMAKYANRLAELKQETGTTTGNGTATDGGDASAITDTTNPWVSTPQIPNNAPSWEERTATGDDELSALGAKLASTSMLDTPSPIPKTVHSHTGSVSTLSKHEEEVQRGVERVLLAILERANNSRGRAPQQQSHSWQQGEEKKSAVLEEHVAVASTTSTASKEQDDALVKAMSDLLGSASSDVASTASTLEQLQQQPPRIALDDDEAALQQLQQPALQAVPDLTQTDSGLSGGPSLNEMIQELESSVSMSASKTRSPPATASATTELADGIAATNLDDGGCHDELDALVRTASVESTGSQQDDLDSMVRKVSSNRQATQATAESRKDGTFDQRASRLLGEDLKDKGRRRRRVLSVDRSAVEDAAAQSEDSSESSLGSGTTDEDDFQTTDGSGASSGASDDEDSYNDEDETEDDDTLPGTLDNVLGPLSQRAGGTTGVVLEGDSPGRKAAEAAPASILDSLSAAMSMVQAAVSRDDAKPIQDKYSTEFDEDPEAEELMRTLCAHRLPFGVEQKTELLDQIPSWDESNPDEAGYRIIRLTRGQLRRIERCFDQMVIDMELAKASGSDDVFERDLQAAEELLDREEKKLKAAEKSLTSAENANSGDPPEGAARAKEEEEDMECLVDFPGIKSTGKGEMGDLEYFHLPIVFKSHVTGFEPTKDLFLEAGNIIAGQYLVESELGTAAFSTAYKCLDLNSEGDSEDGHEEVCLKVIKNTKDFFDQSLDEIKILELLRQTGKCQEKSLIEMKTFFYHREHLIIVTELLRQNLFEFGKFIIDNNEEPYFSIPRLSFMTRQMLVALEFVHKLGLVHSDIKPENILLSSYSRAQTKLIDFGSSCYLTDRQSSYIQSRSYRAPEVVLGLPYDGRIDIWSLGCVVAEMFTGEVTFQNDSIVSMLSRIEAICGHFPQHMIAQGRQGTRFFTKCGLLYEKVVSSQDETKEASAGGDSDGSDGDNASAESKYCDVFQPKATTLAARLGFASDLLEMYDRGKRMSKELKRQALFVDFVRKLLTIDPETRPTAAQALEHPWMKYAASLTDDDIKYPSS